MPDDAPPARGTRRFGTLTIDYDAREVVLEDRPVALTKTEYLLLVALAEVPRRAMTSEELIRAIWGTDWVDDVGALQVQISRLWAKLGESGSHPVRITSIRGHGYRFDPGTTGDVARSVELLLDSDFVLRRVDPHQTFLGYQPDRVIGQFFSPTDLTREQLQFSVAALIAAQTFEVDGPTMMTFADESQQVLRVASQILLSPDGDFDGLRSRIYLPEEA